MKFRVAGSGSSAGLALADDIKIIFFRFIRRKVATHIQGLFLYPMPDGLAVFLVQGIQLGLWQRIYLFEANNGHIVTVILLASFLQFKIDLPAAHQHFLNGSGILYGGIVIYLFEPTGSEFADMAVTARVTQVGLG